MTDYFLVRSIAERQEWVEAISTAQEEYIQKKMTFAAAADQLLEASRGGELGDTAPVWVPDARVAMCQLCCAEFSLMVRRHHCRACGKVVCAPCSSNKAPLRYRHFEASRVCDACYEGVEKSKFQISICFDGHLIHENVICIYLPYIIYLISITLHQR